MPRKYRVDVTRSAERDAISIYEFIDRTSHQRAAKWFAELERQIRTLSRFPARCPVIPEADEIGADYRHLIWGNYRTIFRIEGNVVYVVRVVHGARLLEPGTLEKGDLPDGEGDDSSVCTGHSGARFEGAPRVL